MEENKDVEETIEGLKEDFKSMMDDADLNHYEQLGVLEETKLEILMDTYEDDEDGEEEAE